MHQNGTPEPRHRRVAHALSQSAQVLPFAVPATAIAVVYRLVTTMPMVEGQPMGLAQVLLPMVVAMAFWTSLSFLIARAFRG